MLYHPIKCGNKNISSSVEMAETVILDYVSHHCDPELKTVNQSSCMTLWPMMLHHHSKFGYGRFSSCGDVTQLIIHWNSEPFL